MKLVDLHYSVHDTTKLQSLIELYKTSLGYIPYLDNVETSVVFHTQIEDTLSENGVVYRSFVGRRSFFYLPFSTHNAVKSLRPDVVIVQGLLFPVQVLALRLALGRKPKIIVQHHGGLPPSNLFKKWFLRRADRVVDAYLFTSKGNAEYWTENKIIADEGKCYEVLEASTYFAQQDKQASRQYLQLNTRIIFLWVGRLNANKDPLTVLRGFEIYASRNRDSHLYMIYHEHDMLYAVKQFIEQSEVLKRCVTLIGKVPHDELKYWYSAADYYLSGSHNEGSGYALIECMTCGCIPIITDIPPFRKITDNGRLAIMYATGDAVGLSDALQRSTALNIRMFSDEVYQYSLAHLSFKAIANDILNVCARVATM